MSRELTNEIDSAELMFEGEHRPDRAQPSNPFSIVNSVLRGRYLMTAVLAVVAMGIGGPIGYHLPKLSYESTGILCIQPKLPRILYENEQNGGAMPMFDEYVESQVSLIESQRVIDLAMQNPAWSALHRGLAPEDVARFTKSLAVLHARNSEIIVVNFTDHDPDTAQIAVNAILDAYQHLFDETDSETSSQRLQALEAYRVTLADELKGLNDQITAIGNKYGSSMLDKLYQNKLDGLNKLETQLIQAELATKMGQSARPAATAAPAAQDDAVLALKSPEIRELLTSKRDLQRKVALDSLRLGEGHQAVIEDKTSLAAVNQQIQELLESYRKLGPENLAIDKALTSLEAPKSVEQLQKEEDGIRSLYEKAQKETTDMGRDCVAVDSLRADANTLEQRLSEAKQRIENLNIESTVGGRITIESRSDKPLAPISDKRLAVAAMGAMGSAGLVVGAVVLVGLLNRKVRHISDLSCTLQLCNRVLGVLPDLRGNNLIDPEEEAVAAHSVHQIRSLLQGRHAASTKQSFAVTSPSSGSGKTSLLIALGLSFAASGSKTLLIDCDIVGGGLTAKMKRVMYQHLGYSLCRAGLITDEQLKAGLKLARKTGKRIGEALIEMQVVTPQQVQDALDAQPMTTMGLQEALHGEPINECFAATATPGLFVMPLGSAEDHHVGQLSRVGLGHLIDQAKSWFDVVLIDTGPALGSLEASVAAVVADQTIFVVSRGEHHSALLRAANYLVNTGANLTGIVLNRADSEDIMTSGYSSSTKRSSVKSSRVSVKKLELQPTEHQSLQLGPVGSAVFSRTNTDRRPNRTAFESIQSN
jgi:polysaccharide biosynthesis transport protein